MEKPLQRTSDAEPGRAWLETLPHSARAEAKAALAALPTDAARAGEGLPLAIAAWILAEPTVAADLLEGWLATADAEGNLTPPSPVVCQWAERIADALPDPDVFRERIMPSLTKCLAREFERYDEKGTGLPVWPSAAEALFPAGHAPGRFTVDLAALLSNEAESFCRLAQGGKEVHSRALDNAEGEQRELDTWLKDTFWNEEESAFHRYDEGGESVLDGSPSGFIPLAWGGRTADMTEGLRVRAAVWDSSAWSARGWVLFFALLMRTPHNSVAAKMLRDGLPSGATPTERAAWGVLAAGAEQARAEYLGDVSRPVRWLDAQGGRIVRVGVWMAAAAFAVLLGWWVFHREGTPAIDLVEMERQARRASEEGRHGQAAAIYAQAAKLGNESYFQFRQAGEWMRLGHYAAAEEVYRVLLEKEPGTPNVELNLALAVLNQGRQDEALGLYRGFAEGPGAGEYPDVAARARLAVELIESQMALDRE